MSEFASAVEYVLEREGGLSENPADSGGITNFGISLRFVSNLSPERQKKYGIFEPITTQTIRELTREQATFIYRGEFWEAARFADIHIQLVCNYIFDMSVNAGISSAVRVVQRSLWALNYSRKNLADDGILGDLTLDRLNIQTTTALLPVLIATRADYYRLLAAINPHDAPNLDGWLNRAYKI